MRSCSWTQRPRKGAGRGLRHMCCRLSGRRGEGGGGPESRSWTWAASWPTTRCGGGLDHAGGGGRAVRPRSSSPSWTAMVMGCRRSHRPWPAAGVGIQFLAERFPDKPVFLVVDTCGLAVNQDVGWYEERCRSCWRCVLSHRGHLPCYDVRQGPLQRTVRWHQQGAVAKSTPTSPAPGTRSMTV